MHTIHTLPNGLRIVLSPQKDSATATVMIFTRTGSRHESPSLNGVSHFLEHLLFKGTKKHPSPQKLAEIFDGVGAENNAYTSKDHTVYFAKTTPRHVPLMLDTLADMFLHSTIPSKELERERGAVIEEIHMYEDMPMHVVDDLFEQTFFGADTPLGQTILGPEKNIRTLSRQEIMTYKNKHYDASRTIIVVTGRFNPTGILRRISSLFKDMPSSPRNQRTQESVCDSPTVAIKHRQLDQTHLYLGIRSFPRHHPDELTIALVNTILGTGMSSRLFTEIREKRGLAYYVGMVHEAFDEVGYMAVRAGISNDKIEEAIPLMIKTLKGLGHHLSESELEKAKEQLIAALTFTLDSSDGHASFLGKQLLLKDIIVPASTLVRRIRKITAPQVRSMARTLFNKAPKILAIIGPQQKKEKRLQELIS